MAHDAFISYSTKDKLTADAVCATLEARGVRCWIAPRDILPGTDWGEAIIDAIEGSRVMVLVFSKNANESPQIKREVERAVNKGVAVVPLRIEDVPMSKSLEYFVSTPHWMDALTPPLERHLAHLADTLKVLLDRMSVKRRGAAPPPVPPPVPQPPPPVPPEPQPVAAPATNAAAGPPDAGTEPVDDDEGAPADQSKSDAATEQDSPVDATEAMTLTDDAATASATNPASPDARPSHAERISASPGIRDVPPPPRPPPPRPTPTAAATARSPHPPPPPPVPLHPEGPGPFPFLNQWFAPMSPNTQIAIVVGGGVLVLMILSCMFFACLGGMR